ncbi:MAG: sensor domain-containing diguanylate cyclase [Halofilum sp. (in: g-proteobacteria)]
MKDRYEISVDHDTAAPERLTIFVNYRVQDYDGDYTGATGIGLSVDSVAELVETYEQPYGRRIFLVDRQGRVQLRGAGYEGPERIREHPGLQSVATKILASSNATARYTDADGRTVHVNSRLIPAFDWYLIVEQSRSDADTPCRWGGDESLILLSDCTRDNAAMIAEKIQATVAARPIHHGGHELAVTVSAGVTQRERREDLSTLVARADAALYRSKHGGRNRVTPG